MKGFVGSVVTGIVIVLIIVCGFACTERVPAGYVGVVYNMSGGVTGETLNQGWHIVAPTKNVTLYSIGIEQSYLTSDRVILRKTKVSQINAEKAKIEAQGKADAELIKANAEAEANKKIAESLTDKLIEKSKYDKWNGELHYIEGNATPIVSINSENAE